MPALDSFYTILLTTLTLLGACLGSFANVVIYRLPAKISLISPASRCPSCLSPIRPYDNIPILSWLLLRGRCRHCQAQISAQYPLLEALCALLAFALALQVFGGRQDLFLEEGVLWRLLCFYCLRLLFLIACVVVAMIDLKHTEIPPEICLPMAALGLALAYWMPKFWPYFDLVGNISLTQALLGAGIGAGLVMAIILIYYLLTRRIGMGGGDIWMLTMLGAFLGWQSLIFIFFAASLQGIFAAIAAVLLGKKQHSDAEMALFRNHILAEDLSDATPETSTPKASDAPEAPEGEAPSFGKLALPFGPFLALAAIEYAFLGHWILPWLSQGSLSPWGWSSFL